MKRYVLLVMCLLLLPVVSAQSSIDILSVSEGLNQSGSTATAHLITKPGSGSIYIDSYPLTRLDTQLSARTARMYACMLAGVDCSSLDFFYQIRAGTTIIGGPSAGAALTVLSYAELMDLDINRSVTMTGTLSGSGLIGPVGGVEQKVIAARNAGFSQVLVPTPESHLAANVSGIDVVGISSIEEAVFYVTGVNVQSPYSEIIVPENYYSQMESVALQLCERSDSLRLRVDNVSEQVTEYLSRSAESAAAGKFYSAASFCFSANLQMQRSVLNDTSQDHLRGVLNQLKADIQLFDDSLDSEFSSVGDLEVYMVVRERLLESHDIVSRQDISNISSSDLAYALERYSSAVAWSSFFGLFADSSIDLDEKRLQQACSEQVISAQEQVNYVSYITGQNIEEVRRELRSAMEYQRQEEWALCMWSSVKVRAQADAIITAAYSGDYLNETVSLKHERAGNLLAKITNEGSFPIMSYSYYEYAGELDNVFSKNLYSEYAIALSTLELYRDAPSSVSRFDSSRVLLLLAGLAMGFSLGVLSYSSYYSFTSRRKK